MNNYLYALFRLIIDFIEKYILIILSIIIAIWDTYFWYWHKGTYFFQNIMFFNVLDDKSFDIFSGLILTVSSIFIGTSFSNINALASANDTSIFKIMPLQNKKRLFRYNNTAITISLSQFLIFFFILFYQDNKIILELFLVLFILSIFATIRIYLLTYIILKIDYLNN